MDDRSFEELVRSVSQELTARGTAPQRRDGRAGFFLVDSWRIRSTERTHFLDYYQAHVVATIAEIEGFRDARILVAPVESSYSWHVQVFYEFESDAILDRFREDFDRHVKRRSPGKSLEIVLGEISEWVLAHEDGALIELERTA